MNAHHIGRGTFRVQGAVVAMMLVLLSGPLDIPSAHAAPCPDVQVVFARGTGVASGVGEVGQQFVDSLRSQVTGRSIDVYPVNYPATTDFPVSSKKGADDTSAHVQNMVANCPSTRMVLGGYSQGAGVIDWASTIMPSQMADHVAAVALFGNPMSMAATILSGGYPDLSPLYRSKTIDLCAPGDPACGGGLNPLAHISYTDSSMTTQAATFAARRLQG
jgi:cutinase